MRTLNHQPHVLFVQVTLSTDNPSFYASTLSDEYALCCRAHRLTFRQLVELARGAIEFTFAPEHVKVRCVDTHTHTRARARVHEYNNTDYPTEPKPKMNLADRDSFSFLFPFSKYCILTTLLLHAHSFLRVATLANNQPG